MHNSKKLPANLICLSHLRWDFVYQRPQHLLSRFAKDTRVYFYEEPVFDAENGSYLSISDRDGKLKVVVPHLQPGLNEEEIVNAQTQIFDEFIATVNLAETLFWYYTPMALKFTDKHTPLVTCYDCMDELSAFWFAHSEIVTLEKQLLAKADVVFTGGQTLYEAKKQYHGNIFACPSSIDKKHFATAKTIAEAPDQVAINGPKIGFYGVIDERFDYQLIEEIATMRPDWQLVLIGPIVKIDQNLLPKNPNIHYIGQRSYKELPSYLAGWDVAILPFLLNDSTKFISPTKTPEYLASNTPVVSTPIRDVINPYGIQKLVHIASDSDEFIAAIETELAVEDRTDWERRTTEFLKDISWDKTYSKMAEQIQRAISNADKISAAS
ncbi:MAG: glycosyltransferase [Bacteroidota bacterium]